MKTHQELAEYVRRKFNLLNPPAPNTILDILWQANAIESAAHGNGKRKKSLKVTSP